MKLLIFLLAPLRISTSRCYARAIFARGLRSEETAWSPFKLPTFFTFIWQYRLLMFSSSSQYNLTRQWKRVAKKIKPPLHTIRCFNTFVICQWWPLPIAPAISLLTFYIQKFNCLWAQKIRLCVFQFRYMIDYTFLLQLQIWELMTGNKRIINPLFYDFCNSYLSDCCLFTVITQ